MRAPRPILALLSLSLSVALTLGIAPADALADGSDGVNRAPAPTPKEPADAEVAQRIAFIEARLERGTAAANRWWYGWYIGWGALTVGQAAVAIATTDNGLRADSAVGAVGSSLGVIPLGFFPFPATYAAAELSDAPSTTPAERRRKLARAEALLKESAEAEAFGRSWISHVLSGTVSVGLGLVLGLGYRRPVSGILNAVAGIALSEAQIWTQPTAAIDDLREYQASIGDAAGITKLGIIGARPKTRAPAITWSIVPVAGAGLGVGASF